MNKLSHLFNVHLKSIIYVMMVLFLIISLALTFLSIDFFVQYSSLPIGLTKAIMGIIVLSLVDDIVFKRINTIVEIKNKNIGYAIIYLANAIIIAACISTS